MNAPTTLRFSIDVDAEDLIRELESRLKQTAPDRAPSPGRTADPYLTRKEAAAVLRVITNLQIWLDQARNHGSDRTTTGKNRFQDTTRAHSN